MPRNLKEGINPSRRDFLKLFVVAGGTAAKVLILDRLRNNIARASGILYAPETTPATYQSPLHLKVDPSASLHAWVPHEAVDGEADLEQMPWEAAETLDLKKRWERNGYQRKQFNSKMSTIASLSSRTHPAACIFVGNGGLEVLTFAKTQQWQDAFWGPLIAGGKREDPPLQSIFPYTQISGDISEAEKPILVEVPWEMIDSGVVALTPALQYDQYAKAGVKTSQDYIGAETEKAVHPFETLFATTTMRAKWRETPDNTPLDNPEVIPANVPAIPVRTGTLRYSGGVYGLQDNFGYWIDAGTQLQLQAIIPAFMPEGATYTYPIWQVKVLNIPLKAPDLHRQNVFIDPQDILGISAQKLRRKSLQSKAFLTGMTVLAGITQKVIIPRLNRPG